MLVRGHARPAVKAAAKSGLFRGSRCFDFVGRREAMLPNDLALRRTHSSHYSKPFKLFTSTPGTSRLPGLSGEDQVNFCSARLLLAEHHPSLTDGTVIRIVQLRCTPLSHPSHQFPPISRRLDSHVQPKPCLTLIVQEIGRHFVCAGTRGYWHRLRPAAPNRWSSYAPCTGIWCSMSAQQGRHVQHRRNNAQHDMEQMHM